MKLYLGVSAFLSVMILSISGFIYYSEYQQYRIVLGKEAQMRLNAHSQQILKQLQTLSTDLLFLSNNPLFRDNNLYDPESIRSLIQFMQLQKHYDQIRFIDSKGMETLRINQGNPPFLQSREKLQSKRSRDYVQQGLLLKQNEILLSRLDLNQENGVVELPYKPTLRLLTPVFNRQGEREGLFVINFHAAELLSALQDVQSNHLVHVPDLEKENVTFLMANERGNWIIAPKGGSDFGFVFKPVGNELAAFSEAVWKTANEMESGSVSTDRSDIVFRNIYPIAAIQVDSGTKASQTLTYHIKHADVVWRMMIELPHSTVHALTQTYFLKSLPYIFSFWAVLQLLSILLIRFYRRNVQQKSELLLTASALENSADGVVVTDKEGLILRVNKSYSRISGYRAEELIGKKTNTMRSGWTEASVYQNMWESLDTQGYWEGELKDRRKNGALYVVWLRIVKIVDPDSVTLRYVGITTDITEKKEFEERITDLAYRDSLTKLPNRHLFHDRLRKAMGQRRETEEKLAVIFIDLDNFKFVNDTAGHLVGDKFLIEIANRFRDVLREHDTLARVGGDEFIVLLEKIHDLTISDVAGRLIESLSESIQIEGHEFFTSASIGISVYPTDGRDEETLIKHADTAMYEAKNSGKNGYRFFLSAMNDQLNRRVLIETNLAKALENNEFTLHYQPQIDAGERRIVGAEALLRWKNEKIGFISPAEFIPIAESTGKIIPITEWIVAQVCRDIHTLQGECPVTCTVAINISSIHLKAENFVEKIDSIVRDNAIHPSQIELEITEGALVGDVEESTKKLHALKRLGYKISIDDFGTGYSSLSYLKQFPFDKLKIDQSFIRSLPDDLQDIGIVRSIIAIAHALRLKVIAEGVESKPHLEFLLREGCALIQGYYFSKPLPIENYREFVRVFNAQHDGTLPEN